jgi:hypothetical protein
MKNIYKKGDSAVMPECLYRASIDGKSGGFPLKTRGNDGQYDPAE